MRLLSSKIAIVICGALFVGGISAALAAHSAVQSPTTTQSSGVARASATAATSTSTPPIAPASTATSTPQFLPPTVVPPNTPLTLQGRVISINRGANTFVLRLFNSGGNTMTCTVNGSTTWTSPSVASLSALQNDMQATVQGIYQGNNMLVASSVDAQGDN